jgi:hypothetical protein
MQRRTTCSPAYLTRTSAGTFDCESSTTESCCIPETERLCSPDHFPSVQLHGFAQEHRTAPCIGSLASSKPPRSTNAKLSPPTNGTCPLQRNSTAPAHTSGPCLAACLDQISIQCDPLGGTAVRNSDPPRNRAGGLTISESRRARAASLPFPACDNGTTHEARR